MKNIFSRQTPAKGAQLEQELFAELTEDVISGDMLFGIHDSFPFTRPGLAIRRQQALDADTTILRRSAKRAACNIALTVTDMLEEAGRQSEIAPKKIETIGAYLTGLGIADLELDRGDYTAFMSAADMLTIVEARYFGWNTLPPYHIVTLDPANEADSQITVSIGQQGLAVLRDGFLQEAIVDLQV